MSQNFFLHGTSSCPTILAIWLADGRYTPETELLNKIETYFHRNCFVLTLLSCKKFEIDFRVENFFQLGNFCEWYSKTIHGWRVLSMADAKTDNWL